MINQKKASILKKYIYKNGQNTYRTKLLHFYKIYKYTPPLVPIALVWIETVPQSGQCKCVTWIAFVCFPERDFYYQ